MREATEIARLRLFLKMVAVVDVNRKDPNLGLEPLPDIDFNVRCGNTLVGYASEKEIEAGVQNSDMFTWHKLHRKIEDELNKVRLAAKQFRDAQLLDDNPEVLRVAKQELGVRLEEIRKLLDNQLHQSNGTDKTFEDWHADTLPFHWYAEFYEILVEHGGFDVIIGNPPYIEYSKIRKFYTLYGYETIDCGNLYAYVIERSKKIISNRSFVGMIVPLSGHSTERMSPLVNHCYNKFSFRLMLNLSADAHPQKLFEGVKFRLCIFICTNRTMGTYTSKYTRWYAEERDILFSSIINYVCDEGYKYKSIISKVPSDIFISIMKKISRHNLFFYTKLGNNICYYHNAPVNWIRAHSFIPYFCSEREGESISTQLKNIYFENIKEVKISFCVLNSNLFFLWWICNSDCYHLNKTEISNFRINITDKLKDKLIVLSERLKDDMQLHSVRRVYNYATTGRVEYDEFYMKMSKKIIDEIDTVLADHYGFTEEELDFIINYDIKYRMGDELAESEG